MALTSINGTNSTAPYATGHPPAYTSTTHSTPALQSTFQTYFETKSCHNPSAFLPHFDPSSIVYCDATLGHCFNQTTITSTFTSLFASWNASAVSTPLEFLGGTTQGAVIRFVDSPAEFGDELRIMSAIDFRDGKIARQVDYWDGRDNRVAETQREPPPYPCDLGLGTVEASADPSVLELVHRLTAAFESNGSSAAADLFAVNAVFEDLTLRARIEGRAAVARYFSRVLTLAPWGAGAKVRHVLGGEKGGAGYEWDGKSGRDVRNGIVGLELGKDGETCWQIEGMKVLWDASYVSENEMERLAVAVLEQ